MRPFAGGAGRSHAALEPPTHWPRRPDPLLAGGAAFATAMGATLAAGGAAGGVLPLGIVGAALAATGLAVLLAAGWVEALALVVLSVPLPSLISSGEMRLAAAAPVAALVVASWALHVGASGRRIDGGALPGAPFAVLLGAFALAAPFATSPLDAAREALNFAVLLALLVAAVDLVSAGRERSEGVVTVLAAVAAVTGALAALETVGVIPGEFPRWGTSYQRAALGFGQPNPLALFLALSVPLLIHRRGVAASRLARVAWSAGLGCAVLGLVGTFSRGAWAALLIGAGALATVRGWRSVVKVWGSALVIALAIDVLSGGALRDTLARTAGDWVLEQRALLLWAGVLMFLDHPLLGVGPGGFATELDRYAPLLPRLWDLKPTPHNAYVQMAAETGVVGLVALVLFLVAFFRVFRRGVLEAEEDHERSLRGALLWSFGIFVVAGLALWPFSHGIGEAVILILALGAARAGRKGLGGDEDAARAARGSR